MALPAPTAFSELLQTLIRTDEADESQLDPPPERRGVVSNHIGTASLPLRHLWNAYLDIRKKIEAGDNDTHTAQMYSAVGELVALGIREMVGTNMVNNSTFTITAGWEVHELKKKKLHAALALH